MTELAALFFAQYFNVFLLGLNSQFVRDQRVAAVMFISLNISVAQFTYTRVVSNTDDIMMTFISGAMGGMLGIASSIYFYQWLSRRGETDDS